MKRDSVVRIDEARCIGCARCLEACPVDAIVGAPGAMHTVVEPWCIGCDLCLAACPVDCMDIVAPRAPWSERERRAAGQRARQRQRRLKSATVRAHSPEQRKAIVTALLGRKRHA